MIHKFFFLFSLFNSFSHQDTLTRLLSLLLT